jgi:hypothetical protein
MRMAASWFDRLTMRSFSFLLILSLSKDEGVEG